MRVLLLQSSPYLPSLGGANKANRLLLEALAARGHACRAVGPAAAQTDIPKLQGDSPLFPGDSRPLPGDSPPFPGDSRPRRGDSPPFQGDSRPRRGDSLPGHEHSRPRPGDSPPSREVSPALYNGVEVRPVSDPARLRAQAMAEIAEIAGFRPDRVLVSSEDPAQVLLEAALETAPGRVVYIAHTSLSLPFGPFAFLPSPGRAALLRRAAAVVTVSRALQEYIRRWGGIEARVLRFPSYGPGPFPQLGRWDAGAVTLINPCAVKGISIFLELARRFPDVPFAAVPTWGTTAADREALAALPNLTILEPDPAVDRIFARTRVLAVPSLWGEAFGQVAVEAMLRGIPVLASDVGGLPEAKLGVPYVLPVRPIERYRESLDDRRIPVAEVPEQDVEPWAAALSGLLADRGRYERLAEEGRAAAHAFVAGARVEPFEELLAEPAAAARTERRLKILLIQPLAWLFAPGGAHKTNRLVMEGLAARGHECRAVAGSHDVGTAGGDAEGLAGKLQERGIPVLSRSGPVTLFRHEGVTVHAVTGGIELGQEAVRQIRDFAPDVVVVSEDRTYVLLKGALEEAPGRVAVFAHSPATLPFGPDSFCADPHNAALVGRAAGILTVSRFMQDYIRRWAGLDSTVVYSPAYPPGPYPLLGRRDAGAVTLVNPSPIKGLAIFLELARRFPGVPFAAVPTWSTGSAERQLLEALPNVEVWEPVEDLAMLFGRVSVLLAPSLWGEAFGQIVVEAMLHGVPVLASDSGGLPEAKLGLPYVLPVARIERWEDRVDDRLVPIPVLPEQDAGPWEKALAELLGDRALYERLAADSHRAAADFLAGLDIAPYERFLAAVAPDSAAPRPAKASPGVKGRLADLSPEKLELLTRRLRRKEAAPASRPAIPRQPRRPGGGGTFPLSFSQQRIWFLERLEPGSALYNEHFAVRLAGPLDAAALARSLASLVARHEVLRTTFREEEGEPAQVVGPVPGAVPLPLFDLAGLPVSLRETEAGRLARAEGARPFDLGSGPLLRGALLRLAPEEHLLMLTVHHIAADHWSIAVVVAELAACYRAWRSGRPPVLPALPIQYADFAAWQRGWLQGEVLATHLAFWRERLAGAPPVLELPADRPRPAVPSYQGASAWLNLPRGLTEELKALARREAATFYMLLLAVFQAWLGRLAGQEDVVVGSPVAGRDRVEVEGLIGVFLNVLPMRGRPRPELPFRDFLGEVRATALAAYAHQELPFEELVRDLAPERTLGLNPVFQVLFNLQNTPVHALDLDGLALQPVPVSIGRTKFDLDLYLEEWEQALTGYLIYGTDLFDAPTARRMLGHLGVLLAGVAADPQARLADLPLLSEPERQCLLAEWNDTGTQYPDTPCLHELVEEQAARTPEAPAVVFEDRILTYRELAGRAGRLAGRLRALGCGPDTPIGVLLERGPGMVVALLGVLKAGGAYLALDPAQPQERIAWMLEESRAPVVLAQESLLSRLPDDGPAVLCLDAERIEETGEPAPASGASADHLAYVLYTSGSTGRPKGVMIPHRGIVNRLFWMQETYGLRPGDRVLQKTPFGFDVSVWEFFWPLMTGASLVIAQPGGHRDPAYLADLIAGAGVTVLHFVPSMLQSFLAQADLDGCQGVRLVVCSGEALSPELSRRCRERLGARLENLYGPTEASVDVTWWSCARETPRGIVPIGRPVANTSIRLLDRGARPVPAGVPGELHIGGVQLARGYVGRPDLTAERFVPDAAGIAGMGERLYRTGDLARWLPDGNLEYLGRLDHQVKLRGHRIELGEIESALAALPGVEQAAVLVRDDAPGGRGLVAFVAGAAATPDLKRGLRRRLPDFMVPSVFVHLEALPLSSNGKVDRRALGALKAASPKAAPSAPRTPTEEILAGVWAEVLGGGAPHPEDSFFDLGGHSLLATQILSRVREAFGVELPLKTLFEAPALGAFAARIDAARQEGRGSAAPPIVPVPRDGELPLSFAQQRLWFLAQLEPGSAFYNVPAAFRALGDLSLPALEAAFRAVLRRHEVLRTGFRTVQGRPVQEIAAADLPLAFPLADLSGLPPERREPEALRLVREEAALPFDLSRAPLLRLRLLRLGAAEHAVCATLHHIASDGWSVGVLLREVGALYTAALAGVRSPLLPLAVQYADFAAWQRRWLAGEILEAELAHWRGKLAGVPPALDLPADRPRPPVPSRAGALHPFALPRELSSALAALCRRQGASLYMALLAAFDALLLRWTGESDLCVGVPIANRNRVEVEGLIGFFVNTLVLRADLSGDPPFAGLLARVRGTALDAYAHQDLPFEKLVEELAPRHDLFRAPLCQVALALQNAPAAAAALPGVDLVPLEAPTGTAKLDLTLILEETEAGISGVAEYSTDLLDRTTVARLLGHLETLIAAAAAAPEARLSELPLLSAGERQQLLVEWGAASPAPPPGSCLHDLFAARAAETPDACAVVSGGERLGYRELDRRAGRLAQALAGRGVRPGDFVGLLLDRSLDLPAGILGVLKAGGAYVPLDPDLPSERLAWILDDARVRVLVSRSDLLERLPGGRAVETLLLDREEGSASGPLHLPSALPVESAAYVIYTSGSTGRPKGVVVSHANVVRLFSAAAGCGLAFGREDVWSLFHSYAFDFSVWELWGALLLGGSVVVVPHGVSRAPETFHDLLVRERVTVLSQTPSAFRALIEADRSSSRSAELALRLVVFGGEALDPADLRPWIDRHGDRRPRLVNMYGITETTVHVTFCPLGADEAVRAAGSPIGRALPDLSLRLLDPGLRPVPIGSPGEICVGGAGLARGYLNRPELTAERFIPDPFGAVPGSRLYRSGDLARLLPEGGLRYLGRIDHQVKIRGYRIEPGEIEAALEAHPGVREAVVLPVREPASAGLRLLAFWVPAGEPATAGELRTHLRSTLPEYMVPAALIRVPALPLTPNGKVDRAALAALPAEEAAGTEETAATAGPRTPTEEIVAGIWAEVLGGGTPGPEDSFFDLGGHSLLSTQVLSRVREAFGVELPLRALFEAPALAAFAARVDAARREGGTAAMPPIPPIVPVPRDGELSLSFAQQRLWFLCQLRPDSPFYNVPAAFRATGELSLPALAAALREVVRRHEVLRTGFRADRGRPVPEIAEDISVPLPLADLSALPASLREPEVARLAAEEAAAPFRLDRPPLLRVRLLRLAPGEHALLATLHHIVSDGWSVGVLLGEVAALYAAARAGAPSPLAPLPVQYADFAVWQRRWLSGEVLAAELAHWRERLAGAPQLLDLPADRPRPPLASGRGAVLPFPLPHGALAAFCRARGATLFMGLCAAFAALLARRTGEEDLVVGAPIANRNRAETEGLIGFFVNTLALRLDVSGDPPAEELLARVRAVALDGYAHQDLPFDRLVEELAPRRDLAWAPLVQVSLALQNTPARAASIPGVALAPLAAPTGTAKLDLSLIFEEGGGALAGTAEYSRDLFDEATVARLAGDLAALAEGLAAQPGARLRDLPLLRPGERGQLTAVPGGRRPRLRGIPFPQERVEALLLACPGMREAAVAVRSGPEGEALVAWVAGEDVEPAALRAMLAAALPVSWTPDAVVVLPALPRAAGGGVDAAALPDPPPREPDGAPASELERTIAEVWREVLGLLRIGLHDNFFDLGGHSLQVVEMNHRLNGRLARQLGREVPMMAHFQYTTVSALAQYLENGDGEADVLDLQARAESRRAAAGRQRLLRQRARVR